ARENYYDVKRSETVHCKRIREQAPSRGPFFGSAPFRAPASLLRSAFGFRFREFADTFAKR
ncbi:hypothetical protein, partial [Alistipes communis]